MKRILTAGGLVALLLYGGRRASAQPFPAIGSLPSGTGGGGQATNTFVIPGAGGALAVTTNVSGSVYTVDDRAFGTNAAAANSYTNKGPIQLNGETIVQGNSLSLVDKPMFLGTYDSGKGGIFDANWGELSIVGDPIFGTKFLGPSREEIFVVGDNSVGERHYRDSWHSANTVPARTVNEFGGNYKNADAALTTYVNELGGSVGGAANVPLQAGVIGDNQPRPMILLDTRSYTGSLSDSNNLVSCNLSSVTNGVNAWTTNGLTAFFTNNNIRMGFVMEDGMLTNHRDGVSGAALLRVNTNRFPNEAANDTMFTNTTRYLSTNGFEPITLFYADAHEPAIGNWTGSMSEWDINPLTGVTGWEYPGGSNPLGAVEIQPVTTPTTYFKDMSTLYMWGVRGAIFQDVSGMVGSAPFQQMINSLTYAAQNPYFNPGQSTEIKKNSQWNHWYPPGNYPNGVSQHGMIVGFFAGSADPVWPQKYSHQMNQLWVESLQNTVEPSGSGPLGWLMGQIKKQANFLTNATGPCTITFAGDGFNPNTATYNQWQDLQYGYIITHANAWFNKDYGYVNLAGFGALWTNQYWLAPWQTVVRPLNFAQLSASNAIAWTPWPDGSRMVWFVNEGNATTNLSISWATLGLNSNIAAQVTEVCTNTVLGQATNAYTYATPAVRSLLVWIRPYLTAPGLLVGSSTNQFQVLSDGTSVQSNNATIWGVSGAPALTAHGGFRQTNDATGNFATLTNSVLTLGSSTVMNITLDGTTGGMTAAGPIQGSNSLSLYNGSSKEFSVDTSGNVTAAGQASVTNEARVGNTTRVYGELDLYHSSAGALGATGTSRDVSLSIFGGVGLKAGSDFVFSLGSNLSGGGSDGAGNQDTKLSRASSGTWLMDTNLIAKGTITATNGFIEQVTTKTSNYTAALSDSVILANAATLTITLPTAVGNTGKTFTIKEIANSTGTVATTSSQNIDASTTYSLSAQYKYVKVISDGTQWWIVASN